MDKKKLFDDNDRYTPDACRVESELYSALVSVLARNARQHSLRELQLLAQNAVTDAVTDLLLDPNLRQQEEPKPFVAEDKKMKPCRKCTDGRTFGGLKCGVCGGTGQVQARFSMR